MEELSCWSRVKQLLSHGSRQVQSKVLRRVQNFALYMLWFRVTAPVGQDLWSICILADAEL